MYCVKCGVELADSERSCPLCETPVYYPGLEENPEAPYPKSKKPKEVRGIRGIYFLVTVAAILAILTVLLCDININGGVTWSDYVSFAVLLLYVVFALPGWFRHPSVAIFVPVDFFAAALYLGYINLKLGADWFFPFAMPVIAFTALIVCSTVILSYYIRKGYLFIFMGASFALSLWFITVEILINLTFKLATTLIWSLYPATAFFVIGIALLLVAVIKPLHMSLSKIFAL